MSEMSSNPRKAHPCEQCSKSFSSSHQLVQHRRIHTGEKPYVCQYCDRGFKQLSHLNQHVRLHTGERPYKCSVCQRAFIQLSNLQQHQKTHSSLEKIAKDNEKRFLCSHCGKGFKTQTSLMNHQSKKHADSFPSLDIFHNNNNGTGNIVIKEVIRKPAKFSCQVCGKAYATEVSYRKHVENQHSIGSQHLDQQQGHHGHQGQQQGQQHQHNPSAGQSTVVQTSMHIWPCNFCSSMFASEFALLTHLEQLRSDPKHQFSQLLSNNSPDNGGKHNGGKNSGASSAMLLTEAQHAAVAAAAVAGNSVNISANLLAENVHLNQAHQLNRNSSLDDSSQQSISPPVADRHQQSPHNGNGGNNSKHEIESANYH